MTLRGLVARQARQPTLPIASRCHRRRWTMRAFVVRHLCHGAPSDVQQRHYRCRWVTRCFWRSRGRALSLLATGAVF